MAEKLDLQRAKEVYGTGMSMFDSIGWTYERRDDELIIESGVKGDDLPIKFFVVVKPKQQVVQIISPLPFDVPEDKRVDVAIAVCVANYGMVDGSFDYDFTDGSLSFRLTSSYRESTLSKDLFEYMVMVAASTVDHYNDKFFMVAKDMMSVQQFLEAENN